MAVKATGTFKFEIKNRWTDDVMFTAELDAALKKESRGVQLGAAVRLAISADANLARANLADANLADANLADANLADANLAHANLAHANLARANLADANLAHANLADANLAHANLADANLAHANLARAYLARAYLAHANLADANLAHANLARAYLARANLARANLAHANLADANLAHANLADANLAHANLADAKDLPPLAAAMTCILPEGDLIGWKKCRNGVLVKVKIPAAAKRSNATGRKCRAEYVEVLEVIGAEIGISQHDRKTKYRAGETVRCESFDENRWEECAGGIHFFITREEAENY
jgi:hypothetical protein